MNIALCLFGHLGSFIGKDVNIDKISPSISFENYNKKILDKNHTDIFLHSWGIEHKENLLKLYEPKSYVIEQQIDFSDRTINSFKNYENNINKTNDGIKLDGQDNINENKDLIFRSQSRWYSNSKVLKILKEYKEKKEVNYDWVIQIRLDLFFFKKINFKKLDQKYFYSPNRLHEQNIAINDHYFISNYENAVKFSGIFEDSLNLSIRPTCAAKQYLDKKNIKHKTHFDVGIDFHLIRWVYKDKNKLKFKLKRLIKICLRIFGIIK